LAIGNWQLAIQMKREKEKKRGQRSCWLVK
jgi:hypothetical protein